MSMVLGPKSGKSLLSKSAFPHVLKWGLSISCSGIGKCLSNGKLYSESTKTLHKNAATLYH